MQTQVCDIVTALFVVDQIAMREFWMTVGAAVAFIITSVTVGVFFYNMRGAIASALSFVIRPKNVLASVFAVAVIIYASTKQDVKVPSTHTSQFRQTTSSLVEPVSGLVEYWRSSDTTNGIKVALFGGTVTQTLDFVAGQFVYAFDSSTSVSTPQGLPNNKLWCRVSTVSNWVATTTCSYFNTNGHFSAAIATLPGNVSPSDYTLWFVGPESNLPPVIIEVSGGIEILNQTITSHAVSVTFKGTDQRFATGAHVYYFQTRFNRDGVLSEWENIASITLSGGQVQGTITVNGFTVDAYHEYRVYSDLEVAQ